MTTAHTPARPAPARMSTAGWRLSDDGRQLGGVLLLIIVALGAGFLVKQTAEHQTRVVTAGNVSAAIPQSWIYQPGAGDLRFSARDPRHPGLRYSVSLVSGSTDLARTVDAQVRARSALLNEFQLLSRAPVAAGERSGQAVTYAYVTVRPGRAPAVNQGRDMYLPATGGILVISLDSPVGTFDDALAGFEQFAGSVQQ